MPVSSEVLGSLVVGEFGGPTRHREFWCGSAPGSQFPADPLALEDHYGVTVTFSVLEKGSREGVDQPSSRYAETRASMNQLQTPTTAWRGQ